MGRFFDTNKTIFEKPSILKKFVMGVFVVLLLGWMRGFEPPASSSTDWRSNQLSYIHRAANIIYIVWEPVKAKFWRA